MMGIVLQSVDLASITQGTAIMIVGILGLSLWAIVQFRNPAAGVMWGVSVMALLLSDIYGLRGELFWFSTLITMILVVIGIAVRVSNSGGGR